jgi:hypothetical protein
MIRGNHIRKYTAAIAAVLSLLAVVAPFSVTAQEQTTRTIKVIGTGNIVNDNISYARKQAISDSLVTAVGLVATDLLHNLVFVEAFDTVEQLLLSDAGNFVQYKVLTETTTGSTYRVMVEATVSVDRIRDLFAQNGILVQDDSPLRVLLLISEKQLEDDTYFSWWKDPFSESVSETTLAETLESQGITIVGHGQFLPPDLELTLGETELSAGTALTDSQAAAFGRWYEAEVVIIGNATTQYAPNAMGDELKSFKGALSVRAIRTDSGELLVETARSVLTADADDEFGSRKALEEVSVRTGALLAAQVRSAWQQTQDTGPTTIAISVTGGYQLSHFVAFRKTLSQMPGVTSLQTRGMTPEETIMDIEYEGEAQTLAESLLLESFDGFGIFITKADPDLIQLSLRTN